jgi:GT2 family glycosyltransferase
MAISVTCRVTRTEEIEIRTVELSALAVVILNWNSATDTVGAVEGLPLSWRSHIIVVDNMSESWRHEEDILGGVPGVMIKRRNTNGGYAAGMNTGMVLARELGYSHAVLVNPDARPNGETLARMLALAGDFALVGTAQIGPGGPYTTAAVGRGVFPRAFDCPGCAKGHHEVAIVSGATIIVDLAAAEAVGWMNESYFHYAEEIDLCLRIRRAGGHVGWSCSTVVRHAVGGSMPHTSASAHYYTARNKILLSRNNQAPFWMSPRLVKDELIFAVRASRDGHLHAWCCGLADGFRGATGRRQA